MKKLIILLLLVLVSSALAFDYGLISKTSGSMSNDGSISIDSRKFTGRVVHYDLQFTDGTMATTGLLTYAINSANYKKTNAIASAVFTASTANVVGVPTGNVYSLAGWIELECSYVGTGTVTGAKLDVLVEK